jgi:hypothetical protein
MTLIPARPRDLPPSWPPVLRNRNRLSEHPVGGQVAAKRTLNRLLHPLPRSLALVLLFVRVDVGLHAEVEIAARLVGD